MRYGNFLVFSVKTDVYNLYRDGYNMDLIERLRCFAREREGGPNSDMAHEAANEIERLQRRIIDLESQVCKHEFMLIDGGYAGEHRARCRKCGFEPSQGWTAHD